MKAIRIQTILGYGFTLAVLAIIVVILGFNYIEGLSVIKYIEDTEIHDDILNGEKLLDLSGADLEQWAIDYAVWDDTYFRMTPENADPEFFNENFGDWIPHYYGVDFVYLLDHDFDIVYAYNNSSKLLSKLRQSPFVHEVLSIKTYDYSTQFHGLYTFENTLYQIAISPVLKSDTSGPNKGMLILLKEIDEELIHTFKESTGRDYFIMFDDTVLSENDIIQMDARFLLALSDIYKTNDHIYSALPVMDINNSPCATLGIQKNRAVYNETARIFIKNSVYFFTASLIALLCIRYIISKYVVRPIKTMESQLIAMNQSDSLAHILVKGPEEIKAFIQIFNQLVDRLSEANQTTESLSLLSNTDELTGLYNHRYIFEYFSLMYEHKNISLWSILVDIDRFKMVNEAVGYNMGDLYLRQIAALMRDIIGDKGTIFRYSGEVFLALIPQMNEIAIYDLADKIRIEIENAAYFKDHHLHFPITASIGIASYPEDGLEIAEVLLNAEYAVNYSKVNGRNQVTRYTLNLENAINKDLVVDYQEIEHLIDSVMAMAEAIDSKDSYTGKHSHFVAEVSSLIAEKLNLSQLEKDELRIGALLHDTGKIGLSDALLHKATDLTRKEYEIIKSHPRLGYNIVRHFIHNNAILACVRNHHERWDGKGYPDQLKDQDIPLFARIVSAADAYHAMASRRPYRNALTMSVVIDEFIKHSGTQFDPKISAVIVDLIEEGRLNYIDH